MEKVSWLRPRLLADAIVLGDTSRDCRELIALPLLLRSCFHGGRSFLAARVNFCHLHYVTTRTINKYLHHQLPDFFFADLSAGFWHHKSTGWFVTFILTPQRGFEYQLCYTSVFFYTWHLLHREMWSLVTSCGSLSGGVGWFNHVITVKMMF